MSQRRPKSASASKQHASTLHRPLAKEKTAALVLATDRVEQLETENGILRAKLSSLRNAQSPMTRILKPSTKFWAVKKPEFSALAAPPASTNNSRVEELQQEVTQLRARLESIMQKYEAQMKHVTEQRHQNNSDIKLLAAKVRGHQDREDRYKQEIDKLRLRVKQLEQQHVENNDPLQMKMMEEVRGTLLDELNVMKRKSHELHSNLTNQKHGMMKQLDERESFYRKKWNEREEEFQECLNSRQNTISPLESNISCMPLDVPRPSVHQSLSTLLVRPLPAAADLKEAYNGFEFDACNIDDLGSSFFGSRGPAAKW